MKKQIFLNPVIVLLLILVFPLDSLSQDCKLLVTVTAKQGEKIPLSSCTIYQVEENFALKPIGQTGKYGTDTLKLKQGIYRIKVSKDGFQPRIKVINANFNSVNETYELNDATTALNIFNELQQKLGSLTKEEAEKLIYFYTTLADMYQENDPEKYKEFKGDYQKQIYELYKDFSIPAAAKKEIITRDY